MSGSLSAPEDLMATALRVCTAPELEALRAREALRRLGRPDGYRSVARTLGIGWTTARDRLERAEGKIARALGGAA